MSLEVSERAGVRHYTHNGEATGNKDVKAMSVTSIISAGFPKGALLPWSVKMCAERAVVNYKALRGHLWQGHRSDAVAWLKSAAEDYSGAAAERGSRIHDTVEARLKGLLPPELEDKGEHDAAEHVLAFLNRPGVEVLHSEEAIFESRKAPIPYAGRVDLMLRVTDPKLIAAFGYKEDMESLTIVADIKCGKNVWSSAAVQMAAYAAADHLLLDNGKVREDNLKFHCGLVLHAGVRGCRLRPVHWERPVHVNQHLVHAAVSDLFRAFKAAATLVQLEVLEWQDNSPIGSSLGTVKADV